VSEVGPDYARKLKRRQGRLGDIWHLDEVFIRINGQQQHLWRAVDQDGDLIDILVQPRRDQRAAERFFRRLLRGQPTIAPKPRISRPAKGNGTCADSNLLAQPNGFSPSTVSSRIFSE
jgi:transposase-like protein